MLASEPNPFLTPEANRSRAPTPNVFRAPSAHSRALKGAHALPVIALAPLTSTPRAASALPPLPPLPPPLPPSVVTAAALSPPVAVVPPATASTGRTPAERGQGSHSCSMDGLPAGPVQAEAGGQVTVRLSDAASRCIAGVESRDDWVRIKFFNGRELHLEIDPNTGKGARASELVFASMTDSQVLRVSQAAPRTTH